MFKKTILPILLATIWISLSEFIRNEFLLKSYWTSHYETLGLTFPAEPINGAIWGVWSLLFAVTIFIIKKRFTLIETTILSWVFGFVMMWLVVGNMMVLPYAILPIAIPLSFFEAFLAALIVSKFYQ